MHKSLLDKLTDLRQRSVEKMPTPELAILHRAIERLRRANVIGNCLQKGESVPDFSVGEDSLYSLVSRGPVILNFFRGFWCSYCRTEMDAYGQIAEPLVSMGVQYVAISPQNPLTDSKVTGDLSHAVNLYDKGNWIAKQFGLVYSLEEDEINLFRQWGLDLQEINQSGDWELPLPATYVVGEDRIIAFQFVDVDFRCRCCPIELLEKVEQLIRVKRG